MLSDTVPWTCFHAGVALFSNGRTELELALTLFPTWGVGDTLFFGAQRRFSRARRQRPPVWLENTRPPLGVKHALVSKLCLILRAFNLETEASRLEIKGSIPESRPRSFDETDPLRVFAPPVLCSSLVSRPFQFPGVAYVSYPRAYANVSSRCLGYDTRQGIVPFDGVLSILECSMNITQARLEASPWPIRRVWKQGAPTWKLGPVA